MSRSTVGLLDAETESLLTFNDSGNLCKVKQFGQQVFGDIYKLTAIVIENHLYFLMRNGKVLATDYLDSSTPLRRKADMTVGHGPRPPAALLNGMIYVVGGHVLDENPGGGFLRQFWEDITTSATHIAESYDPKIDQWKRIEPLNAERMNCALVAAKGDLYCIGGNSENPTVAALMTTGQLKSVERYSPATDTWTYVADLNTPRFDAAVAELNGKIYVLGGKRRWLKDPLITDVEVYDPETNAWTPFKPLLTVDPWLKAATVNGNIFAGRMEKLQVLDREKVWSSVNLSAGINIFAVLRLEIPGTRLQLFEEVHGEERRQKLGTFQRLVKENPRMNEFLPPEPRASSSSNAMVNVTGGNVQNINLSGIANTFGNNAPAQQTNEAASSSSSARP